MSGIMFLPTTDLEGIKAFYCERIGLQVWLEQHDCVILKEDNMLLGFCTRPAEPFHGILTFFYPDKADIDNLFQSMAPWAEEKPRENEVYQIYHFFARDPEDRRLEFQAFLQPVAPHLSGDELLRKRRSIRTYADRPVPDEVLWSVFELCRYAPTSMNTQAYTFTVIKDREKLEFLAGIRGGSSSPIAAAPMAVAITTDPNKTKRPEQDGCIAAYHFLLAAKLCGLGTCWIGGMDRDEVKDALGIPTEHYLATVTPLGYPAKSPRASKRRSAQEMVHMLP